MSATDDIKTMPGINGINGVRVIHFWDTVQDYSGDGVEEDLVDLLADMLHACAHNKQLNFERILRKAQRHFEEENDRA